MNYDTTNHLTTVVISALIFAWWFFMMARVIWIHRMRKHLYKVDPVALNHLPSDYVMMNRFWIWDVSKFINFRKGN